MKGSGTSTRVGTSPGSLGRGAKCRYAGAGRPLEAFLVAKKDRREAMALALVPESVHGLALSWVNVPLLTAVASQQRNVNPRQAAVRLLSPQAAMSWGAKHSKADYRKPLPKFVQICQRRDGGAVQSHSDYRKPLPKHSAAVAVVVA